MQDVSWARKIPSCKSVCHRLLLELKAYAELCWEVSSYKKHEVFWDNLCAKKKIDSLKSVLLITRVKITYLNHFQVRMVFLTPYIYCPSWWIIDCKLSIFVIPSLFSILLVWFFSFYLGCQTMHLSPALGSMEYRKPLWSHRS